MCGIAGFVGVGSKQDLHAMMQALVHRGPDKAGDWCNSDAGIYIGHQRLSIIDIEGGKQPMWSPDGRVCVSFNGEIYNHQELREQLVARGARFHSDHSDTEVLVHGYQAWGEGLADRLNGMWAFAIYDRDRGRLWLSRDRFGEKPLYYFQRGSSFVFASELTALLRHPLARTEICRLSLKKYFAYGYIPAPATLYKGIAKLPAGHGARFQIDSGDLTIRRYWQFRMRATETSVDENSLAEELQELLSRAVERRMMADVPLGVFLSGGIDSAAIAACAARCSDQKIKTFTVGFDASSFDETPQAAELARHIGSDHSRRILDLQEGRGLLEEIVRKLDEPLADASLIPTYLLCRETRKDVKVALSGDGADELFAGYDTFKALRWARWYRRWVPHSLHPAISACVARLPVSHRYMSLDMRLKRALRGVQLTPALWNPAWLAPLATTEIADLLQEPVELESVYEDAIVAWDQQQGLSLLDRVTQFYVAFYLQDDILVKTDRASMMHSLEVRAPFLDIDLVNFVQRLPARLRLDGGRTKVLLKKALRGVLPEATINRRKHGFALPVGSWFKQQSIHFSDDSLNPDYLAKQMQSHVEGKVDQRLYLWAHWVLNRGDFLPGVDAGD